MTVDGDLIIEGAGDITIDNVNVSGKILITNGSIVSLAGGTKASEIQIRSHNSVSVNIQSADVKKVTVDNAGNEAVISGSVAEVNVNSNTPVMLNNANIATVNVNSMDSFVAVFGNSTVRDLSVVENAVYSQVVIEGSSVENAELNSLSSVITASESTINSVTINGGGASSAVVLSNSASAETVTINAIDTILSVSGSSVVLLTSIGSNAVNTIVEVDIDSDILRLIDDGINTVIE
jgi:hypothetical protein